MIQTDIEFQNFNSTMGRRSNSGLDYFSFDVDFFNDPKIEFVAAKYGNIGEIITVKLLCRIYREGYFITWGEDEAFLFAAKAGPDITKNIVDQTVEELASRDFFSEKHFKKFSILTSNGIQLRYLLSTSRRQETEMIKEYLVADITGFNVNITALNADIMYQSKVKESKVKESKDKYADFVNMTKEEHSALVKKFGESETKDWIEKLNLWKGSKGKKTKSDYYTILSWERKNGSTSETGKGSNIGTKKDFGDFTGKINF